MSAGTDVIFDISRLGRFPLAAMGRRDSGKFWQRSALALAFALVLGLAAVSTPLVANSLTATLQIYPALSPAEAHARASGPPTAIVILSAGRRAYAPEFGDGETLDALSLERVRYGARLAHETGLPVLVSGGLGGNGEPSLAMLMADTLSKDFALVPRWQEDQSRNTAENAIYSSAILKKSGIGRVFLVTHAWHMPRARAAFLANGMTVIPAPTSFYGRSRESLSFQLTPNPAALRMSSFALHEIIGRVWYRLHYGY